MAHISIRVSERERRQMEIYASLHGVSLSDAVKSAFFERLDNEFDMRLVEQYENDPDKGTVSHEEMKKRLGL